MLTVTDQRPAPAELSCLCAMYFTKIGIDANIRKACLGQQESNLLRPSALGEMNLRQNFQMTGIHVLGPTWEESSQGARNPATGDEIAIDQQQLSARTQNALPFCEGRSRIDEGPYKVAGYDHIETCIGQHGTLRISLHKGCGRNFGAGALKHGLVMGVKNAMPVDRDVFNYYIRTVQRLFGKDAPWCAAGIGQHQATLNDWAISSGGHARTVLEDNVRLDRDTLAPSNTALVRRAAEICEQYHRPVARWTQARDILGLAHPML